jgi:hypothetical protein
MLLSPAVIAVVLLAAILHAGWNVVARGAALAGGGRPPWWSLPVLAAVRGYLLSGAKLPGYLGCWRSCDAPKTAQAHPSWLNPNQ